MIAFLTSRKPRAHINTGILFLLTALILANQAYANPSSLTLVRANTTLEFKNSLDKDIWLNEMSERLATYVTEPKKRALILKNVIHESERNQLNPHLVLSIIHVESHFRDSVRSSAGARGLMQIMPFWKNEIGNQNDDLYAINTNIRYGCAILRHYLQREKGDIVRALARYNGSLGKTWYSKRVLKALASHWSHDIKKS